MITIIFIVDGHGLEAQAALLAASLVHHNRDRFHYIAYVAQRHVPHLNPDLVALFDRCGVEVRHLAVDETMWVKAFPHGNKILACADPRDQGHAMFLDTDMICTAPLHLDGLLQDRAIAVTPEGKPTWGKDISDWEKVYARFDLPLPQERITLLRGKRRSFVPYFNAGMVLFPDGPLVDGKSLGDLWLQTALVIDHDTPVLTKRPWLDQISLPVTLKRFGLDYVLAPEELNFSAASRVELEQDRPMVLHYHKFGFLAAWARYHQAVLAQTRALAGATLFDRLDQSYGGYWHQPATLTVPVQADP